MYISILYFNFENFALRKFIKPIFFVLCYVGPSVQTRTYIKKHSTEMVGWIEVFFKKKKI